MFLSSCRISSTEGWEKLSSKSESGDMLADMVMISSRWCDTSIHFDDKKEALNKELQHIRGALQACQFPNCALNQLHQRFLKNNHTNVTNNSTEDNNTNNNIKKRNISLVVLTFKALVRSLKSYSNPKVFQIYLKGTNTLRSQLVTPKGKDPKTT